METTYRDHYRFLPLELGDIPVSPHHLGAVQGPETAHHFDGALRRVGHLPRCCGDGDVRRNVE